MAKKTYTVTSPIKHDGEDYAVGEQIDLDPKEAAGLLDVHVVEAVAAAPARKKQGA